MKRVPASIRYLIELDYVYRSGERFYLRENGEQISQDSLALYFMNLDDAHLPYKQPAIFWKGVVREMKKWMVQEYHESTFDTTDKPEDNFSGEEYPDDEDNDFIVNDSEIEYDDYEESDSDGSNSEESDDGSNSDDEINDKNVIVVDSDDEMSLDQDLLDQDLLDPEDANQEDVNQGDSDDEMLIRKRNIIYINDSDDE